MLVGISSQSTDHLLPNGQHLPNVPQPIIEVNQVNILCNLYYF